MVRSTEKKGKLFLFMAAVLGAIVIVLNVLQINVVSLIAKNQIEKTTVIEAKEVSAQASISVKHLLEAYFNALDYYAKSDAAMSMDDETIVNFMMEKAHLRPDFFNFIGYVNAQGHNYTDKGGESDVKERDYFQAIMSGNVETYIDNPVFGKTTGLKTIHVCKAIKVNGRTTGLFFGAADPDLVSKSLAEMDLGNLGFGVNFW